MLHFAVIQGIRLHQVLLWLGWQLLLWMSREKKFLIPVALWISCERLALLDELLLLDGFVCEEKSIVSLMLSSVEDVDLYL